MNILHVISTLDPRDGGPPMIASHLAAAEAGLGHDVALIRFDAPQRESAIAATNTQMPHWADVREIRLPPLSTPRQLLTRSRTEPMRQPVAPKYFENE